jgi:hypothetical protein
MANPFPGERPRFAGTAAEHGMHDTAGPAKVTIAPPVPAAASSAAATVRGGD